MYFTVLLKYTLMKVFMHSLKVQLFLVLFEVNEKNKIRNGAQINHEHTVKSFIIKFNRVY